MVMLFAMFTLQGNQMASLVFIPFCMDTFLFICTKEMIHEHGSNVSNVNDRCALVFDLETVTNGVYGSENDV